MQQETARAASAALMGAVDAAGRGHWAEVCAYLNSHPGLTPCTVGLCLARILVVATVGEHPGDDGMVVTTVWNDGTGDPSPEDYEEAQAVAAIVAAIGNGDTDGAHEVMHNLDEPMRHRVIGHLLLAADVVVKEERDARNN